MRYWVLGATMAVVASAGIAQQGERLPRECRQEIVQLCGMNRDAIRGCLKEKAKQLSENCRAELRKRVMERGGEGARGARVSGGVEHAYGGDPLQKLDFYAAKANGPAPLLIHVHGGGWKRGDKGNATGRDLAPHYTGLGYAVASVNYRLVPQATVEQQAADVAASVAWLHANAQRLGIDANRIVLTGHSAGAHLVALIGTDPRYLRAAGLDLNALRGVIPNDGAAYNVPAQMGDGPGMMKDTYVQAFGTDPARQKALSPYYHAAGPNAPAFLLIHVQRPDGVRQAAALGEALRRAGTPAEVKGFPGEGLMGHMEINRRLGDPAYPATPVVDAWLKRVFS